VDSGSGKTYQWILNSVQYPIGGEWFDYRLIAELPGIYSTGDLLKVHLINTYHSTFEISHFGVEFYIVDAGKVKAVLEKFPA
jgi:hypothetical protein